MHIRKLAIVVMTLMLLVMAAPAAMAAESDSTWSKVKAAGSDLWDTVKEKAPSAWEKTKETASDLYGKAKEKAPEIKEKVKTGVHNAQDKISDFNQDQKDQFWAWVDDQTGGTANTAPDDDTHNPDGNAEYEPGPEGKEPYEPGPGAAGSDSNSSATESTEDSPDDVYGSDDIYYYDPDGDTRSASSEVPGTITVDGEIYQYVPEDDAETKQPDDREYHEIIVEGRVYRHYYDEDVKVLPEEDNPAEASLAIFGTIIGIAIILIALISLISLLHARESEVKWRREHPSDCNSPDD